MLGFIVFGALLGVSLGNDCERYGGQCQSFGSYCPRKANGASGAVIGGCDSIFQSCCLTLAPPTKKPIAGNNNFECGKVAESGWRIISGSPAKFGQFPWQVSLHFQGQHVCGGTLINDDTIVTAAHCVAMPYGNYPRMWDVVVGEVNLDRPMRYYSYSVEKVYQHARWQEFKGNDIAIMKLTEKVPFDEYQSPVCLPSVGMDPADGDVCYVSGFGQTNTDGDMNAPSSRQLLHVDVKVIDHRICKQIFRGLDDGNICAGGHTSKNACRGDSGGPLVCNRNGKWYLHGIVSFGAVPCGQPGNPGVYTRVTSFLDWIKVRS
ncbi:chymotrypsinogen A-like [Tubulanus polymorphus]|uniref:chymotrypsinogen A-like n=1 Tax=Tubulanus polymorphus TaxID=672921 RepID=UPI003DA5BC4B